MGRGIMRAPQMRDDNTALRFGASLGKLVSRNKEPKMTPYQKALVERQEKQDALLKIESIDAQARRMEIDGDTSGAQNLRNQYIDLYREHAAWMIDENNDVMSSVAAVTKQSSKLAQEATDAQNEVSIIKNKI